MMTISIFCSSCGSWIRRVVDPDCPPSHVRCACGTAFSLAVEAGPPSSCLGPAEDPEDAAVDRMEATYLEMLSAESGVER